MTAEPTHRAFIALEINQQTREGLADLMEKLRKGFQFTGTEAKWSQPEGIHLTLKFLGQIRKDQIAPITKVITKAASLRPPIAYSVRGLGVFPNEWRPRVLWAAVKRGAEEIGDLWENLEWTLSHMGFEADANEYHPHLTLARFKNSQGAKGMLDIVKTHNRVFCGETVATRIVLFKSELRPEGAIYTPLAEAPFTGKLISEDGN